MKRVLAALTILLATSLSAQNYNYQTIDVPGALATQARGINDHGDIVGIYNFSDGLLHGFLLSGGNFTFLDCAGAAQTAPRAINNKGEIVGWTINDKGVHGLLIDKTGCHEFDVPGAAVTQARSINNQGVIAGDWNNNISSSCFVLKKKKFRFFAFPGQTLTFCTGINDAEYVLGFYEVNGTDTGFIQRFGMFTQLPIAGSEQPLGMNDLPQLVGIAFNGYMADIAQVITISVPEAFFTVARGINLQGVIVGNYNGGHGFIATPTR